MSSSEDGSDVCGSPASLQSPTGRGHSTKLSEWGLGGDPRGGGQGGGALLPELPTDPPRQQSDPPPHLPSPDPSPPPRLLSKPPPPVPSAFGSLSSLLARFLFHTQTLSNTINRKKEALNRKTRSFTFTSKMTFTIASARKQRKRELPSLKAGDTCSEKLSNLSKVTPHHQLLLSTAPTWESLEKGMEGAAQTAIASPSWSHALRDARFAGVCVLGGDPWDSLAFAPLGQPLSLRPRATFLPTTVPPSSGKRQPK